MAQFTERMTSKLSQLNQFRHLLVCASIVGAAGLTFDVRGDDDRRSGNDAPTVEAFALPAGPNVLLGEVVRPPLHDTPQRAVSITASSSMAIAVWAMPGDGDGGGWGGGGGESIVFARSTDGGVSWTAFAPLPSAVAGGIETLGARSPRIATDHLGRWVVVWEAPLPTGGAGILGVVSTDDGVAWSAPVAVDTLGVPGTLARDATVVWLGESRWSVVGMRGVGGPVEVRIAHSVDGGVSWGASSVISGAAPPFNGIRPTIAADGVGGVIAGWLSEFGVMVTRSDDWGDTWTSPVAIATSVPSETTVGNLVLAPAGDGWIAAWRRSIGNFILNLPHIVEVSRSDDGTAWSEPIAAHVRPPGETLSEHTIAASGSRVVLVWAGTDSRSTGTDFDIFVRESLDAGMTWGERRVVNAGARGDRSDQLFPVVAVHDHGWIAGWVTEPGVAAHPVRTISVRGFRDDAPCPASGVPGAVDCDGDGADDGCAIELAWLDDCAGLGIPSGCAIASGILADCDGDGIPDVCAIAAGLVDDCDGDGVPDACQLANYRHVDGFGTHIMVAGLQDYTMIERFERRPGVDLLTAIGLRWTVEAQPAPPLSRLCVWSDPVGDGNPVDAELLECVEFLPVVDWNTGTQIVPMPTTDLSSLPGDHFFVGVITTWNRSIPMIAEARPSTRAGTTFFSRDPAGQVDPADLAGTTTLRRWPDATFNIDLHAIVQSSFDLNGDGILDACQLVGDLNGDGVVDGADLGLLLQAWGSDGGANFADLNGDGVVDGADLGVLLDSWS